MLQFFIYVFGHCPLLGQLFLVFTVIDYSICGPFVCCCCSCCRWLPPFCSCFTTYCCCFCSAVAIAAAATVAAAAAANAVAAKLLIFAAGCTSCLTGKGCPQLLHCCCRKQLGANQVVSKCLRTPNPKFSLKCCFLTWCRTSYFDCFPPPPPN